MKKYSYVCSCLLGILAIVLFVSIYFEWDILTRLLGIATLVLIVITSYLYACLRRTRKVMKNHE
ncbi:MAG: hypothetical protein RR562_02320 [Longicatena sp.]